MKEYTMYVCETCGFESKDREVMEKHEADHLGLTGEELREYEFLKNHVSFMERVVQDSRNSFTESKYNNAVKALDDFKRTHWRMEG